MRKNRRKKSSKRRAIAQARYPELLASIHYFFWAHGAPMGPHGPPMGPPWGPLVVPPISPSGGSVRFGSVRGVRAKPPRKI